MAHSCDDKAVASPFVPRASKTNPGDHSPGPASSVGIRNAIAKSR